MRWLDSLPQVANNRDVIRRVIAAWLGVALVGAAAVAPLVHAHPDDLDTDHHSGGAVHAHLSPHTAPVHRHPADHSFSEDDHDRAVPVDALVAVSSAAWAIPLAAPVDAGAVVSPERPAHTWVDAVYGHDPPAASARIPRAPPALLS